MKLLALVTKRVRPGRESPGTEIFSWSSGQPQRPAYDQISPFATRNWPAGDQNTDVCSAPREGTERGLVGVRATVKKGRVWDRQALGLIRESEAQIEQTWWEVREVAPQTRQRALSIQ